MVNQELSVLFLITARGGSKGIPGKNLHKIAGISLVGYKAISARKSQYCSRLIISTDSVDIQSDAASYGVEVPFLRPAELATDTATSAMVITHTIEWFESIGERFDAIMLLEPSSPFARSSDYNTAIELMIKREANAVVGVKPVETQSVYIRRLDEDARLLHEVNKAQLAQKGRRQDLDQECAPNGALYLFKWDYFKKFENIYYDGVFGYMMDSFYSVEIDNLIDLRWAEFLVKEKIISTEDWR